MKIVPVGGKPFSSDAVKDAIKTSKRSKAPIELLVEDDG